MMAKHILRKRLSSRYVVSALVASALVSVGASVPAAATIFRVDYAGTYDGMGGYFISLTGPINYLTFAGTPFTATFLFDTSLATSITPTSVTGGYLDASIYLPAFNSNPLHVPTEATSAQLAWENDGIGGYIPLYASAFRIVPTQWIEMRPVGSFGFFQFGICPGGWCGGLKIDSATMVAVPGPITGGGLPGLLAALGLLFWRRLRPHMQA